jgi:hypothetical protein
MNYLILRSYDNYIKANLDLSMLQDAGIRSYIKDEYTVTIDPLLSPALGGMKLMVDEEDLSHANHLLEEADRRELEEIACPVCRKHSLSLVTEVTHFTGWAEKLRSLLINGQVIEVKKCYRCSNCKTEFSELPLES